MNRLALARSSRRPDTGQTLPARNFNGAAVVDEHGHETPITDSMILQACRELERHWCYPGRHPLAQTAG